MTPERFAALAEAYGGDLARWPEPEREAARALRLRDPACEAVIAHAAALDAALAMASVPAPGAALVGRVIAAAAERPAWRVSGPWRWLTGAALAGACAAGLLTGALVGPLDLSALSLRPADAADEASALIIDADAPGEVR